MAVLTSSAVTSGAEPTVVGPYLARVLADPRWARCTVNAIAGGKSNLTYVVRSRAGRVVLRRPPPHSVLPTAHDMVREHAVITALAGSDVPVPVGLHLCTDDRVLGAPFHVMSYVDGPVVRGSLPAGYADAPAQRAAIADALVDVLADLHAVDPAAVGLGEFGRPAGFLARQLRRWVAQWEASRSEELPALESLAGALTDALPIGPTATVVHGDYRLDNVVLDPREPGRIAAVLDWEMSTVGDPLADLGLLLVYWPQAGDAHQVDVAPTVTRLPGFPTRRQLTARYARRTGRDLSTLPWYVAFGCFKLAVVATGIVARHRSGAMISDDVDRLGGAVAPLIERGRAALAGAS